MRNEIKKKRLPRGVSQRKDGLYMGRFQYEGDIYPPVYGKTIREVEEKLADLRYRVTHQLYTPKSQVTLDEWFDIWIKEYRGIRLKKGTIATYNEMYKARIKPFLGQKKITGIQMQHIQKLYNDMAEKGYAEGTIKIISVILYGMMKQAVKCGIILRNPVELATIPRAKPRKERVVLSESEQKLFQEYAYKYSPDYRIFLIALCTGMRNGEVRGLCWGTDIDFEKQVIHVTGTLKYVKGIGHFKDTPKSKTSARDIPMLGICRELLQEQKRIQDEQREFAGEWWQPKEGLEDLVFTTDEGKVITRERLTAQLHLIQRRMRKDNVEIPEFTFHTLRHTFATRGLEQGIPLKVMQTILGHTTFAMTSDLYSHVLPTTKAKEMEKLEAIFK